MERQRLEARVWFHALFRRPALTIESIRAYLATRQRGAVVPSSRYLGWRAHTAYGDNSSVSTIDLIHYLSWRRAMRRLRRSR